MFIKKIEPIGSKNLFWELFLDCSELIREGEIITLSNDSSTADKAENSNPNVPIKGKKVKTIETTNTIANEINTIGENSILTNVIGSPIFYRESNCSLGIKVVYIK